MPVPPVREEDLDGEQAIMETLADYHRQLKPLIEMRAALLPGNNPASLTVPFGATQVTVTKPALIEQIRQALRQDVTAQARTIMADAKSLRQS